MLRESRFLCVLPGSWHQQMHLFRKQNRDTCFTAVGFIRRIEPPGKHQIHGYVQKDLPSETANVSLQQTERSRFQDPIDMQASVLSVIHMSVTSWPQDAASCFWWEESIKLSLGGSHVPHSASRSSADRKIVLQGNQRLLLSCREHTPPSSRTVKIYRNLVCYSSFESSGSAEPVKGTDSPCTLVKRLMLPRSGVRQERRDHLQM